MTPVLEECPPSVRGRPRMEHRTRLIAASVGALLRAPQYASRMKDPVALAYSGRIPEAREAAVAQASSDEPFLVREGLEALAVLGQQHGVRTNAAIDELLARRAEEPSFSRKAFEAATSLGSRALEESAARRLTEGEASWEVLRYAGEWPSDRLGAALRAGFPTIPEGLKDEAFLTSCAMPVCSPEEAREFGRLAIEGTRDPSEEVRRAAFTALRCWAPTETASLCARALTDPSAPVRKIAAETLAEHEPDRLIELAEELGPEAVEVQAAIRIAKAEQFRRMLREETP